MNGPRGSRGQTLRRRLAGVVFVLVPALLIWLSVAVYDKKFTASDPVVVETGSVGNQMHPGAEVKLRGVVVGEVRAIDATGGPAGVGVAVGRSVRNAIVLISVTDFFLSLAIWGATTTVKVAG